MFFIGIKKITFIVFLSLLPSIGYTESAQKTSRVVVKQVVEERSLTQEELEEYYAHSRTKSRRSGGAVLDSSGGVNSAPTGQYGIPFGTSLSGVLKWCQENRVIVRNETDRQVEQMVSLARSGLSPGASDLDLNSAFSYRGNQGEIYSEDLNSPHFNYYGQTFVLHQMYQLGERVVVGGAEKICKDKRITNSIYELYITPSAESGKLVADNVKRISIYFTTNNGDKSKLISYATLVEFQGFAGEGLSNQYNSILRVLTEKYGSPLYREQLGYRTNNLFATINPSLEENSLEWDILHLTGNDFTGFDALIWQKNKILITRFNNHNLSFPAQSESSFYVIYYEPTIARKLLAVYLQTVQEFIRNSYEEIGDRQAQMRSNF